MKYSEHCQECLDKLGKPYGEVHKFLDEYVSKLGFKHRRIWHHQEGIYEVGKRFGEDAIKAARLHIISDLKQEGWKEGDKFPKNEADYIRKGLY